MPDVNLRTAPALSLDDREAPGVIVPVTGPEAGDGLHGIPLPDVRPRLGFLHAGTPNLDGNESGLIDGAGPFTVPVGGDQAPRILNFVRTGAGVFLPDDMTWEDSGADKGKFVLPAGHWVVYTSVHVDVTTLDNDRVVVQMGIYHGANLRHAQSVYFRHHAAVTVGEGYVSVAGAVVSDGSTHSYVGMIFDTETDTDTIQLEGAHLNAYQQDARN